jgi:hypothetical protein
MIDPGSRGLLVRLAHAGILALILAASAGGCDNATSPTPPDVPATVSMAGNWFGSATDSHRVAQLSLVLKQDAGNVTGSVTGQTLTSLPLYTSGTLTGTVVGSTLTFTIRIPTGSVADAPTCSVTMNGSTTDVTTSGVAATGMSGTYTGTDSCFGDLAGGRFTFAKQ